MRYLIVNADDFGYSLGINKGIIEAHLKGIVTSTSVMVDAMGANEAADLKLYPDLSVGLHFVPNLSLDVMEELDRQVQKFISITGEQPTHIDIHKVRRDDTELKETVHSYAQCRDMRARYSGITNFIDSFFGPHANGDVSVSQLMKAIDQATDEYNEIMCHVGYSDDYLRKHSSYSDMRENELETICSPTIKQYIDNQKDLSLINGKRLIRP